MNICIGRSGRVPDGYECEYEVGVRQHRIIRERRRGQKGLSVVYRKKWLFYLITGLIFVSFMHTGLLEEMAACRPRVPDRLRQQLIRPSEAPPSEYKFPDEAENLISTRLAEAGKQPGQGRHQHYRYFAIMADLYLLPDCAFRTAVRRFGTYMIKLWQEIDYIHCADGEKENASLNME